MISIVYGLQASTVPGERSGTLAARASPLMQPQPTTTPIGLIMPDRSSEHHLPIDCVYEAFDHIEKGLLLLILLPEVLHLLPHLIRQRV